MFAKFFSRKLIVALLTGLVDYLVATGQMDPAMKAAAMNVITGIGGGYVALQAIIDMILAMRKQLSSLT